MGLPDAKSAGRSNLIPYRHGEPPGARHARRKAANLEALDEITKWATNRGIAVDVKNDGHHWIFRKDSKVVEWWPSSAKMIVNKQWKKGIHVHDYAQAKDRIGKILLNGEDQSK